MTDTKKTNEPGDENEDWAVLPFDEAEDDARWARLSAEMDELEKEVDAHEAIYGKIIMEEDFNHRSKGENDQAKTEKAGMVEDDLF